MSLEDLVRNARIAVVDDEEALTPEEQQEAADRAQYIEALRSLVMVEHPEMKSAFGGQAHDTSEEFAKKHQAEPWFQRMALDMMASRVRSHLYEVFSDRKPKYIADDLDDLRRDVKLSRKRAK